jgi:hypothetical protein
VQIERFEYIKAWQETRVLMKMAYAVVDSDRHFGSDYKFREQIHSDRDKPQEFKEPK